MPTTLTPQLVRNIIDHEETPLRGRSFQRDAVESIFRYGAIVGRAIEQHRHLPRAMDRARELIRSAEKSGAALASGTTILADTLSAGKGRFRRQWHAPPGGLWLTVIVANTLLPAYSRLYPLAAGTACCETLRQYAIPASIKWVNDVHVDGKKIAGILVETEISPVYREEYVLIGIGINANNDVFPVELASTATSMKSVGGSTIDVKLLAARLLAKLAWNIGLLHHEEGHALQNGIDRLEEKAGEAAGDHLLLASWRQLSDIEGRRVLYGYDVQNQPLYEATVLGVDSTGGLLLKLADGTTCLENSGEILYLDNYRPRKNPSADVVPPEAGLIRT